MTRASGYGTVAVLAAALFATACGGSSSTTSPSGPTTDPTTETFTGTVPVGGSDMHPFNIALSNGQVNIILTQAGPPSTIFMGLGVGAPSGSTCALFSGGSTVVQAGTVAQLSGTAGAGAYCVQVYDVGNQSADVTYSVTVTHY
jgi:hypothetical protein